MIELISAIIGTGIALFVLLFVPIKMKKKKKIIIVLLSMVFAIIFQFISQLYNLQIAIAATLLLVLCVAVILTKYKDSNEDELLQEELQPGNLSQPLDGTTNVEETTRKADLHMDQRKIDEYIRSLEQKRKSNDAPVEDNEETQIETSFNEAGSTVENNSTLIEADNSINEPEFSHEIQSEIIENNDLAIRNHTQWDLPIDDKDRTDAEENTVVEQQIDVHNVEESIEIGEDNDIENDYDEEAEIHTIINHSIEKVHEIDVETIASDHDDVPAQSEQSKVEEEVDSSATLEDMLYEIEIKPDSDHAAEAEPESEAKEDESENDPQVNTSKMEHLLSDLGDFVIEVPDKADDEKTNNQEKTQNESDPLLEERKAENVEKANDNQDIPLFHRENKELDPADDKDVIKKRKLLFEELENDLFK
ncbi:hypothetical protein [Calidifontibacillus oryziterrae]|uniref:hypothetical protein n=1 Tax=Calidifontibacillus oryziterrae TaxID=1191699 RepID=UPI0002E03B77|nr:hypothetical protein [Calidifontibacillus oryziterrae]